MAHHQGTCTRVADDEQNEDPGPLISADMGTSSSIAIGAGAMVVQQGAVTSSSSSTLATSTSTSSTSSSVSSSSPTTTSTSISSSSSSTTAVYNTAPIAPANTIPEAELQKWIADSQRNHTPVLHYALRENAPLDVIRALLTRFPESAHQVEAQKNTPLHIAVSRGAPLEVLKLLVNASPQVLRVKSFPGSSLPIHEAVQTLVRPPGNYLEEIKFLVQVWPPCLAEVTYAGWTPLHIAVYTEAHLDTIKFLLTSFPDAARSKNMEDLLPLHLGLYEEATLGTIRELVSAWPESLKERDTRGGNLPLHMAIERGADYSVIPFLVNAWPESVHELNNSGETPRDIAVRMGVPPNYMHHLSGVAAE